MLRRLGTRILEGLAVYGRAVVIAFRSVRSGTASTHAYALTFRTLVALVPFLAVLFSVFQAFGGLDSAAKALETKVVENLAPGTAAEISRYIWTFVHRVSAGAVGGIGIVFLILAAISLFSVIEKSFNHLWNIDRQRPFLQRFILYWSMVTVGPVLLALSLTLTTAAQAGPAVLPGEGGPFEATLAVLPWLLTCTGMTVLYLTMPNTRVRWQSAVGGGLIAGSLWELGKLTFTWASKSLFSYDAIYGSFGVLPVFLLWLQIGWIIVLFGCKVTYASQHAAAIRDAHPVRGIGQKLREFLAVLDMVEVVRAHRNGEPPPTSTSLAAMSGAPIGVEKRVLNRLERQGFLVRIGECQPRGSRSWRSRRKKRREDVDQEGFVPARDASRITVQEVLDALRRKPRVDPLVESVVFTRPLARYVAGLLECADRASAEVIGRLTLAEAAEGAGDHVSLLRTREDGCASPPSTSARTRST